MEEAEPDLSYIIDLMRKKSGIVFSKDKSYIILTKLFPLLKKYELTSVSHLISAIKLDSNYSLISDLVDALTINETSFYRDKYPFEALDKEIVPKILLDEPLKKEIRILCAACSSGQEPYSIAMHFLEHNYKLNFHITAIDLSNSIIRKAAKGIYNQFEVQRGLPITLLIKYFNQIEKDWIIKDEIKKYVSFKQYNLMNNLNVLGKFDIIFCRNILIYFDQFHKELVINNIIKIMNPNATLILGGSELISWDSPLLKKITDYNGIYSNNISCFRS